jgi:hypothetical protein
MWRQWSDSSERFVEELRASNGNAARLRKNNDLGAIRQTPGPYVAAARIFFLAADAAAACLL